MRIHVLWPHWGKFKLTVWGSEPQQRQITEAEPGLNLGRRRLSRNSRGFERRNRTQLDVSDLKENEINEIKLSTPITGRNAATSRYVSAIVS
jgi:hypothetical protein